MGVFEFVITVVLISSVAKIIESRRRSPTLTGESFQMDAEELHRVRETISDLSGRVERLEEERYFYKDLLEPRPESRSLSPPKPEA
jgi:hypothetical protein